MKRQMTQALWVMAVMTGVVAATGTGSAQAPATGAPPAQQKADVPVIPLKVTVVITRHKSDKARTVISRLPFELWVNTGNTATVRLNSDVPVPTTRISQDDVTRKSTPVTSYTYRPVGTSLTVEARALSEGRFLIPLSIEDSQIIPTAVETGVDMPTTGSQSLRSQTAVILRDGETVQHSLATDRITGDVTKIEVTLNVVK